jgi:hypothetical protein
VGGEKFCHFKTGIDSARNKGDPASAPARIRTIGTTVSANLNCDSGGGICPTMQQVVVIWQEGERWEALSWTPIRISIPSHGDVEVSHFASSEENSVQTAAGVAAGTATLRVIAKMIIRRMILYYPGAGPIPPAPRSGNDIVPYRGVLVRNSTAAL